MQIFIKPYLKKNGEMMVYINNDRKVSIGVSNGSGFAPYGKKATGGQRNLWSAFWQALENAEPVASGFDQSKQPEDEPLVWLDKKWATVATDISTVGGVAVGEDGQYIINIETGEIYSGRLKIND